MTVAYETTKVASSPIGVSVSRCGATLSSPLAATRAIKSLVRYVGERNAYRTGRLELIAPSLLE